MVGGGRKEWWVGGREEWWVDGREEWGVGGRYKWWVGERDEFWKVVWKVSKKGKCVRKSVAMAEECWCCDFEEVRGGQLVL